MSTLVAVFVVGLSAAPVYRFASRALYKKLAAALAADRPYSLYECGFPERFNRPEALEALGFEQSNKKPSEEEIKKKYRELMKELHSDIGGTPYIAQRLNEAKEASLSGRK